MAFEEAIALEYAERLPDRRAGDAAFGDQGVDDRDLPAQRPLPCFDPAAEQPRQLDITRHGAAVEVGRTRACLQTPLSSYLGRFRASFSAKMLDIAPLCLRFLRRNWREIDSSYSVGSLKTRPSKRCLSGHDLSLPRLKNQKYGR